MDASPQLNPSSPWWVWLPSIFLALNGWLFSAVLAYAVMSFIWHSAARRLQAKPAMEPTKDTKNASAAAQLDKDEGRRLQGPSPADVYVVRTMLTKTSPPLPPELVEVIIEEAEYWPCSVTVMDFTEGIGRGSGRAVASAARRRNNPQNRLMMNSTGNELLFRTPPIGLRMPPSKTYPAADLSSISALEEEGSTEHFENLLGASMPRLEHPVRKIVFTTVSHDQGWGGQGQRGAYTNSWTWFEAGLEKFDMKQRCPDEEKEGGKCSHGDSGRRGFSYCKLRPCQPTVQVQEDGTAVINHSLLPDDKYAIQRNAMARVDPMTHTVVWSCEDDGSKPSPEELFEMGRGRETATGEFVRSLRAGDVVTVWAKARFAGWVNLVNKVSVEIYWAV